MKNKTSRPNLLRLAAGLAWLLAGGPAASAAVAFTVNPAAISNTYNGPVIFQVTGLTTAADTVVVQKYLDANGDGVIDAGDVLVQQFNLTDGQPGMVIGGVTNFNVPGDTDGVAGQITARLLPAIDFSQLIAGNYLFKLSSPAGHFAPLTNSFAVTSFPFAQKFTGTVTGNGAAVPHAAVLLFQGAAGGGNGNPVGGAVADGAGVYTIPAPPGTYALTAFQSNFVANTAAAGNLVLGAGQTVATNLSLIPATQTITGQVVDAANPGLGLPGLLVSAQNKSQGLLAICYTDTNGNFTAGVTSNQWKINSDSAALAVLGYAGAQNGTGISTTNGSVAGVTIALTKATALIYGTVKDIYGNPLAGVVAVYAYDQNNNGNGQHQSDGYTDANGNFVAAVVGGLGASDPWQVQIDNASSFPNYNFSQPLFAQNGGTNLSAGQAVLANITALPATNQITGKVKYNGTNLAGLSINAYTEDTNNYQAQATTDSGGNYTLTVGNGTWNVNVNCQGDNGSLQSLLGTNSYQCPCGPTITISNNSSSGNNIVVPPGGSGGISGYLSNTSAGGIGGVSVYLQNECSGQNYSTVTGGNGYYSINVPDGVYNVNVDCGGLNSDGYQCLNNTNVTLSSATLEVNFTAQASGGGGGSTTLFGYVQDAYGDAVTGVTVSANNGGGVNSSTTTDGSGYYGFTAGNGTWEVSVSCSGLNSLGYACVSDESTNIYMDTVELDFTVQSGGFSTPPTITTTQVPPGLVGATYDQQLSASGGQAPYLWSLDAGSLPLPAGLQLATNGVISGPLTAADLGTNYFLVDVTDHWGDTASQFYTLIIYPALTMATNALPGGTVGTPYSAQILVSGGDPLYLGETPDGYGAIFPDGPLPAGLNFSYGTITSTNEYFVISGTPTNSGTFAFTLGAYDADENVVEENFSITIGPASLRITTASLTNATAGAAYTNQLQGSGGTPPYTWTIALGSQPPPATLTLTTNGLLAGVPAAGGTNSFIVRLTDHNSLTTTHTFTLVTNPKPSLRAAAKISATQFQFLLAGAAGQNYTLQMATNLSATNWTSLYTTNSATNSFMVVDPNATNQQRFYRILIGP
jgi:hypothetical protein